MLEILPKVESTSFEIGGWRLVIASWSPLRQRLTSVKACESRWFTSRSISSCWSIHTSGNSWSLGWSETWLHESLWLHLVSIEVLMNMNDLLLFLILLTLVTWSSSLHGISSGSLWKLVEANSMRSCWFLDWFVLLVVELDSWFGVNSTHIAKNAIAIPISSHARLGFRLNSRESVDNWLLKCSSRIAFIVILEFTKIRSQSESCI